MDLSLMLKLLWPFQLLQHDHHAVVVLPHAHA